MLDIVMWWLFSEVLFYTLLLPDRKEGSNLLSYSLIGCTAHLLGKKSPCQIILVMLGFGFSLRES